MTRTTSYAVIDTGTDYMPAAIANNGMILATGTLTSQNVITDLSLGDFRLLLWNLPCRRIC